MMGHLLLPLSTVVKKAVRKCLCLADTKNVITIRPFLLYGANFTAQGREPRREHVWAHEPTSLLGRTAASLHH